MAGEEQTEDIRSQKLFITDDKRKVYDPRQRLGREVGERGGEEEGRKRGRARREIKDGKRRERSRNKRVNMSCMKRKRQVRG